jgi:large repetitive protein
MRWTQRSWFRNVSFWLIFLLLGQSFQPMSFGLPQPQISLTLPSLGPATAYAQDQEWLTSTIETNYEDRFIQEMLNQVGPGAQEAFEFVRNEIGYESYKGSLRGARGTLWSKAGNSLDQASLLIALLRSQGISARYVQGSLSDESAKELILSMFPSYSRVVGCPSKEALRADPINDTKLLAETKEHFWVEFDDGNGFKSADPTFKKAKTGEVFGSKIQTFAEVPDTLRHKVTLRLKAEINGSFPGSPPEIKVPLEKTFRTVELVGKPLTVGHFVNSFSPPSMFYGYTTHTYSPYILLGESGEKISQAHVIRGESYQEFFTNFPLASQFLTGLILEMDVIAPSGTVETYERTLLDRIGFANRQSSGPVSLGIYGGDQPSITNLDLVTIQVLPGLQSLEAIVHQQENTSYLLEEWESLEPIIETIPSSGSLTEVQRSLLKKSMDLAREATIASSQTVNMSFAGAADQFLSQLQTGYLTKAYYSSPRIYMTISWKEGETQRLKFDLRKNDLRTLPLPGQVANMGFFFEMARGYVESTLEGEILSQVSGQDTISIADIFAGIDEDNNTELISQENIDLLETLNISEDAKARISQAIIDNKTVIVPSHSVNIDNVPQIAWFETDWETGHTIGVMEDGGHQALAEYTSIIRLDNPANLGSSYYIGSSFGYVKGTFIFLGKFLENYSSGKPFSESVKLAKLEVFKDILLGHIKGATDELWGIVGDEIGDFPKNILDFCAVYFPCFNAFSGLGQDPVNSAIPIAECLLTQNTALFQEEASTVQKVFKAGTVAGMWAFLMWSIYETPLDPPVFQFLSSSPHPELPNVIPGDHAEVNIQLQPDELFYQLVNGVEIPSIYKARIQNLGPEKDTFNLVFSDVSTGYLAQSSISSVTIPAGETAEVGVCLQMDQRVGAPGEQASFTLKAISAENPSVEAHKSEIFTTPKIPMIDLENTSGILSTTPGASVPWTIKVISKGNVPVADINLALDLPSNLTASGLPSRISLGSEESKILSLTLTSNSDTPLNSTLTGALTATYGDSIAPQTSSTSIRVQVVIPGVLASSAAANTATQMKRPELADSLNSLAKSLTALFQNPSDELYKRRILSELDRLIQQLDDPLLTPFATDLIASRDLISSSTSDSVFDALNKLNTCLTSLTERLSGMASHNFNIALRPNSAVAFPENPTSFDLFLHNTGTQSTTYNLNLSGIPEDVTAVLNRTTVTLAPGEMIPHEGGPNVVVTLTQPANEIASFAFAIVGVVEGDGNIARSATGAFNARKELIKVVSVKADPAITDPGEQVTISTRLLNAVNQAQQVLVSYTVKDPSGEEVIVSSPRYVKLSVLSSLDSIDLEILNTEGFEKGNYSIEVSVQELNGELIPGATSHGNLVIGSSLVASIAVTPEILAPGDWTVNNLLKINTLFDFPEPEANLIGLVDTEATAYQIALKGRYAYVGGTNNITIVDIENSENPTIIKTFGPSDFVYDLEIIDDHLVVLHGDYCNISIFSLENPTSPSLVGQTSGGYRWPHYMFLKDKFAFVSNGGLWYKTFSRKVITAWGDVLSFDLSDFTSPKLVDVLFNNNGPPQGGIFSIGKGAVVDDHIALVPSTTVTGSNTQNGMGRVLVVDMSDPANLLPINELTIPGTVQLTGIAVNGKLALVVGSTGGMRSPGNPNFGLTGKLTLTTLDITNPENPEIISTLTTESASSMRAFPTALENGYFALTRGLINKNSVLLIVDANDPPNLLLSNSSVPSTVLDVQVSGNLLYTAGVTGLAIYDIGSIVGTRVTSQVQIPKDTGVTPKPDSFNIKPTHIVSGSDFDTLIWEHSLSASRTSQDFTWQSDVTDLQPGEAREIVLSSILDFVQGDGASGQLTLPPQTVVVEHILALFPAEQTVRPGEKAAYVVTVKNPTATTVTYNLSLQGIPQSWAGVAPKVTVPPLTQTQVFLNLTSESNAPLGAYGFVLTASTSTSTRNSVHGTLNLEGRPLVETDTHGVVLSLTPNHDNAGQGTEAKYVVRLTNTGNVTEQFVLSGIFPAGFIGSFGKKMIEIPPSLTNYREVPLQLTPAAGTTAVDYSFTVKAVSTTDSSIFDQKPGVVTVTGQGVNVNITPDTGTPGSLFELNITNTGTAEDTFDLSLGGPAGPAATLSKSSVTLPAGNSQSIRISLEEIDFAYQGTLDLLAVATSRANEEIKDQALAKINIPSIQGLVASIAPESVTLETPGAASFSILVRNTGNTEDAFTATVTGTTGPVTANLNGLDEQPTQQIPTFRLPGLSSGTLVLNASLDDFGEGTVTVTVTSKSNPSISASTTATVRTEGQKPIANAGVDQSIPFGETVHLNGDQSLDPDPGPQPLFFQWEILSTPETSDRTNEDIEGRMYESASFIPDVPGLYVVRLTVFDGELSASDEVTIQVNQNTPPVADAGEDINAKTGKQVTLNGSEAYDPDGDIITFAWDLEWSLEARPEGSALSNAEVVGKNSPNPSFIPDVDGIYVLRLTVNDGDLTSEPDFVEIIASTPSVPPNVDAGLDKTVLVETEVILSGSASDPDNGSQPLTCHWCFKERPVDCQLEDNKILSGNEFQASFVPDVPGRYVLVLQAFDGQNKVEDEVVVTASDSNVPPNADAGRDQRVLLNEEVILSGSTSRDPDDEPEIMSYNWRFVSLPEDSNLTQGDILNFFTATPQFLPDTLGSYILQLEVSDGVNRDFDNTMITVVETPTFQDLQTLVEITMNNERSTLNRRTREITSTAEVNMKNISGLSIAVPIHALFTCSAPNVNMPEASGINSDGDFYYDLGEKLGVQELQQNESITFSIKFLHSASVRFNFDIKVFGAVP